MVILFCDTSALIKLLTAEAMAGMARRQREDPISGDDIEQVSQRLVETAGRFADVFALRGYDSVQLAAAHELDQSTDQPLTFACFDRRLKQAASLLQLKVLA